MSGNERRSRRFSSAPTIRYPCFADGRRLLAPAVVSMSGEEGGAEELMSDGVTLEDPGLLRDRAYIDGQWTAADNGGSFAVRNPADGNEIGRVPNLGVAETRRAIEAA